MPGNALCVQLPKSDWENLIAAHGKEIAFTGRNGSMPCIYPVNDVKDERKGRNRTADSGSGRDKALVKVGTMLHSVGYEIKG